MDEQHGDAQQDAPLQDSPLRRLWTRLRAREPVRPTWRPFALNAAVVPLLAAFQFFYATLRNSFLPAAGGIDFVLFWGFPLCLIPASLLRAGWLWLRSGSWRFSCFSPHCASEARFGISSAISPSAHRPCAFF